MSLQERRVTWQSKICSAFQEVTSEVPLRRWWNTILRGLSSGFYLNAPSGLHQQQSVRYICTDLRAPGVEVSVEAEVKTTVPDEVLGKAEARISGRLPPLSVVSKYNS
uniref:Uncharacterized protein n=1 Tax=Zea mays TaxID=4577 RepID=A0A804NQ99_MAIZE